jgi:hypothetical protein
MMLKKLNQLRRKHRGVYVFLVMSSVSLATVYLIATVVQPWIDKKLGIRPLQTSGVLGADKLTR